MSIAANVAFALVERVERRGGARAGLRGFRALAQSTTDLELRGRALAAALRCAVALRDRAAIGELTGLWVGVERGVWDEEIVALCTTLAGAGLVVLARDLAAAEKERHRGARALYLWARCLELVPGGDRAVVAGAYREASVRAFAEGAKHLEIGARVRRAVVLARAWSTVGDALEEARGIDLAALDPASKLALAGVLLHAPSRFVRAGAIGALDEIATGDNAALATKALRLATRFVDEFSAVTPLELERAVALFGHSRAVVAPQVLRAARVVERAAKAVDDAVLAEAVQVEPTLAPIHARARDLLAGRFEPAKDEVSPPDDVLERRAFRAGQVLDVFVALRDAAPARAARSLRLLAAALAAGEPFAGDLFGIAHTALAHDDGELREAAASVFAIVLAAPSYVSPPFGWLALADNLAGAGKDDLAAVARRVAAARKEPGAADSLGTTLARAGWEHAKRGDHATAIQKLREAKAILDPSTARST